MKQILFSNGEVLWPLLYLKHSIQEWTVPENQRTQRWENQKNTWPKSSYTTVFSFIQALSSLTAAKSTPPAM
jgi:hypothetical protein